jgi:hypothetical protein
MEGLSREGGALRNQHRVIAFVEESEFPISSIDLEREQEDDGDTNKNLMSGLHGALSRPAIVCGYQFVEVREQVVSTNTGSWTQEGGLCDAEEARPRKMNANGGASRQQREACDDESDQQSQGTGISSMRRNARVKAREELVAVKYCRSFPTNRLFALI